MGSDALTAASDGCVYYYSPDGQGPYCYPEDYGSACDTHDDGLEPDCAAGTTPASGTRLRGA